MDFNEIDPCPVFRHTIPELPTGVSWFGANASIRKVYIATSANVSDDGENFIIQDQGAKKVFHLTKTTIRHLHVNSQLLIHDVFFMGNNAAICSFRNKSQFSLYNLKTKDFVKTFHFKFDSFLSLFGKDCIWSVGPTMTVYRQIADTRALAL
jgi:hypothetical protein